MPVEKMEGSHRGTVTRYSRQLDSAGKLQMHILGAISEFERGRIQERVRAGLARARSQGRRLGRPRLSPLPRSLDHGLTVRQAARLWGVSKSTAARRMAVGQTLSSPA